MGDTTDQTGTRNRRLRRNRILFVSSSVLLTIVLTPYFVSRLRAPGKRIQTFSSESETAFRTKENRLTILSFNIAHGRGPTDDNWAEGGEEKSKRVEQIAAFLEESDADVVVLNEVDFDSSWSGRQNQAAAIAGLADYPYRIEQRNLDFALIHGSWRFGNAVLSKHPLQDAKLVDFPDYSTWETWLAGCKRGITCTVTPPGRDPFRLMAVHLSHRSESLRAKSARMILEMADSSTMDLVVAGDFNSTPRGFPGTVQDTANAMDLLNESKRFQILPSESPSNHDLTFSSTKPKSVIDWILIPRSWIVRDYSAIDSSLSDHRPVAATVLPQSEMVAAKMEEQNQQIQD